MTDKVEKNETNEVEETAKKPQAKSATRKKRTPAPTQPKPKANERVVGNCIIRSN